MTTRSLALVLAGLAAAFLRPAPTVLAPAVLAPAMPPPAHAQEEDPPVDREEEEQEPLPGLLGVNAARAEKLMEALPGSWQLTDFIHSTNQLDQVPIFGFLSIEKDGYLNVIIHTREPEASIFEDDLRVQAGVHHWRISERGFLQTSSILAHTNFSGDLGVELVFTPREYAVTIVGETLILRRPDDSQLVFERLGEAVFPNQALRRIEAIREGTTPERF